ncbi:hypothetical protein C1280_11680 [Gemmata obscuriglobus]|uniref:Uncharacterized protein n=2 Tax=Gemmata obscuriglobus TaxID=114 RepID=A0A2Z3H377_9BACT|nr:hypothetical protein C1280_11455 [Gemmata obscuriglobus]AWM42215.1 hypothetical protein C1280_11680 [Gemmata obscuriglobus]
MMAVQVSFMFGTRGTHRMSLVVRLCVCNDADSGADRLVEVVPSDFSVALRPGEECVVTAVGLDAVPSLTVVESAYGTHVICEGGAAVTVEGPRRYQMRGLAEAPQEAEPGAAPDTAM